MMWLGWRRSSLMYRMSSHKRCRCWRADSRGRARCAFCGPARSPLIRCASVGVHQRGFTSRPPASSLLSPSSPRCCSPSLPSPALSTWRLLKTDSLRSTLHPPRNSDSAKPVALQAGGARGAAGVGARSLRASAWTSRVRPSRMRATRQILHPKTRTSMDLSVETSCLTAARPHLVDPLRPSPALLHPPAADPATAVVFLHTDQSALRARPAETRLGRTAGCISCLPYTSPERCGGRRGTAGVRWANRVSEVAAGMRWATRLTSTREKWRPAAPLSDIQMFSCGTCWRWWAGPRGMARCACCARHRPSESSRLYARISPRRPSYLSSLSLKSPTPLSVPEVQRGRS
ncbi:hypothetical protein B0H14DRAFT_770854 [Mycena olivaceomarginata]|nr:hypothetical protein B0H14DRAFT_770854 [Mycena olivaceomarginata]